MPLFLEKLLLKLFLIQNVFAQNGSTPRTPGGRTPPEPVALPDPFKGKEIAGIIANVTHFLAVNVAPALVAVIILVGAIQMIFSGGSPERFKAGQKTIIYAVIGFFIVLIATGVAALIKKIVTGN